MLAAGARKSIFINSCFSIYILQIVMIFAECGDHIRGDHITKYYDSTTWDTLGDIFILMGYQIWGILRKIPIFCTYHQNFSRLN